MLITRDLPPVSPVIVTGLTTGENYTFALAASNKAGAGKAFVSPLVAKMRCWNFFESYYGEGARRAAPRRAVAVM